MTGTSAMNRNSRFLQREFRRALIPVMLSVLGGTVNTLIDSAFVSRRLDSYALAALSLNMPVFLGLCMIGCLFGAGAFLAASRVLGENQTEVAGKYFHSAFFYSFVAGAVIMLIGIFFPGPVARLLSKDPGLYPLVYDYCRVTLIGALPYIMIYLPTFFLQLEGKSAGMTIMMAVMIITDVIFDFLFLYVIDGGVAGAALASVLSMMISCGYGFYALRKGDGLFRLSLKRFRPFGFLVIAKYGSTQSVASLIGVLRMFALNALIYRAGGKDALAVWTVVNSLTELSLSIISGVPRTASPLLGIYIGGHDNEGIRMLIRCESIVGELLTSGFAFFCVLFCRPIGLFFKLDQSVLLPLVCMGFALIIEMGCSILGSYYSVAGRILLSNLAVTMRTFLFPALAAWILLKCGAAIWLFLPLGMLAALGATLLIAMLVASRSKKGSPGTGQGADDHSLSGVLLLDDYLERNHKVKGFSIVSSDERICRASEDVADFCKEHGMDGKTAARLGLTLEEVMTVMARKSLKKENDPVDVRVYSFDDKIGLSVMCAGEQYNIFEQAEGSEDDFNMGVRMINKLSKDCKYLYTLGMNILTVEF